MPIVMVPRVLFLIGLLLSGCASRGEPTKRVSVQSELKLVQVRERPSLIPAASEATGPKDDAGSLATLRLTARRTSELDQGGNRLWTVELHGDGEVIVSWDAVSGHAARQEVDRFWTPGNASPLPPGVYSLGQPEPWGEDLWFDLLPRFSTTRSALGIHRCYPGTGCLCIPNRDAIEALAAWVRESGLAQLTVLN
ncbi:hypothetical protein [Synechococcus sp. MIT S1220]|uniref:hypothetical protein n=1 Tax=Synechococcus sp. MIT S1220 TaxID=3082549 RepID=UPI0039AEB8F9